MRGVTAAGREEGRAFDGHVRSGESREGRNRKVCGVGRGSRMELGAASRTVRLWWTKITRSCEEVEPVGVAAAGWLARRRSGDIE